MRIKTKIWSKHSHGAFHAMLPLCCERDNTGKIKWNNLILLFVFKLKCPHDEVFVEAKGYDGGGGKKTINQT